MTFSRQGVAGLLGFIFLFATHLHGRPRQPLPPWPEPVLHTCGFDEPGSGVIRVQWLPGEPGALKNESWTGHSLVRD